MARKQAHYTDKAIPQTLDLRAQILDRIDAYLAGSLTKTQIREWAVQELRNHEFRIADVLLAAALRSLLLAGNPDVKHSDSEATLREIRSALLGQTEYTLKVRHVSREELERRVPGALASIDEAAP